MSDNSNNFDGEPAEPALQLHHRSDRVVSLRKIGDDLLWDIYHGEPPVEYAVSQEPWGSLAFRPGEVIAFAAPPGSGKTAFVLQTTLDALRLNPNVSCMIVNVEMSARNLYERQLARLSGIPLGDITRRRNLLGRKHDLDRAIATIREHGDRMQIMKGPFHINDIMDAMVRDARPDILVIDYLQRIECCEGVSDTRARVNALMNTFRRIAEAGVCVVLVSAVGRPSSKKGGGYNSNELGLASLRESSEIEYGCDDIYIMAAEEQAGGRNGDSRRTLLLKHEKSRNNSQQNLRFEFEGAIQRFYLLPPLADDEERAAAFFEGERGYGGEGGSPSGSSSAARPSVQTPQADQPLRLPPPGDRFASDFLDSDA